MPRREVVDPAEYDDLARHVGVGHGIWLIVGVLASYDDGRNVRVTMDGRDATSKVFGREVLCRLRRRPRTLIRRSFR